MRFKNETELAERIVTWCTDQKWDVYQEVEIVRYGSVADIVAVQNGIVWVIETKLSLSLSVFDQAAAWVGYAHYVSVGVPTAKRRPWVAIDPIVRHFGFGIIEASSGIIDVHERVSPRLNRTAKAQRIRDTLCEQHKTFAKAGTASGGRFTPFKETCLNLREYVDDHPGTLLKPAIDSIKHHYASSATARSCLAKWLQQGIVPGVECRVESGKVHLYSMSEVAEQ